MTYHQITFEERYTLGLLRQRGLSSAAIGALAVAALPFGQGFAQAPGNTLPLPGRVLTVADATPDPKGVRRMVVRE